MSIVHPENTTNWICVELQQDGDHLHRRTVKTSPIIGQVFQASTGRERISNGLGTRTVW